MKTKSKNVGRGGFRKGAGRPSQGKTAQFATRLTQGTRDLLEEEAMRTGGTLSVTSERLLRSALRESAERRRPDSLRSLFFVMEMLLLRIQGSPLDRSWRSSPYLFVAFRAAVIGLLDVMRPAGEVVSPPAEKLQFGGENAEVMRELFGDDAEFTYPESPEQYGREMLRDILREMDALDRRRPNAGKSRMGGEWVEVPFGEDENRADYYAMSNAKEHLGLPFRGRKNERP